MKKSSKSGEESERNQELIKQLNDLEKEWETLKKGKLQNTHVYRCSTVSDSNLINSMMLENSPRGLMYSLQRRKSPSDVSLRVKNCDMAVEEVIRERRAAIMSGKLRGRQLFVPVEGQSEVELDLNYDDGGGGRSGGGGGGGEVCAEWLNIIGEREVVINENGDCEKGQGELELPDAFSDACLSEEKEVVVEEKLVVEKRRGVVGGGCSSGGRRCLKAMAWSVFLLILLILGLVSMSCNGKSVHENELILVPT